MNAATKNKIRKDIADRKTFAWNGYRVRILDIEDDGQVKILKLKATRESFRVITVPYRNLEEIIESPYSHKDPVAFLKRQGFEPIPSDAGRPLMKKMVDGVEIILGHSNPATKKRVNISLMATKKSRPGSWCSSLNTTDLNKAIQRIPEFVRMAKER